MYLLLFYIFPSILCVSSFLLIYWSFFFRKDMMAVVMGTQGYHTCPPWASISIARLHLCRIRAALTSSRRTSLPPTNLYRILSPATPIPILVTLSISTLYISPKHPASSSHGLVVRVRRLDPAAALPVRYWVWTVARQGWEEKDFDDRSFYLHMSKASTLLERTWDYTRWVTV